MAVVISRVISSRVTYTHNPLLRRLITLLITTPTPEPPSRPSTLYPYRIPIDPFKGTLKGEKIQVASLVSGSLCGFASTDLQGFCRGCYKKNLGLGFLGFGVRGSVLSDDGFVRLRKFRVPEFRLRDFESSVEWCGVIGFRSLGLGGQKFLSFFLWAPFLTLEFRVLGRNKRILEASKS